MSNLTEPRELVRILDQDYFTPEIIRELESACIRDGVDSDSIRIQFVHRVDLGGMPWQLYVTGNRVKGGGQDQQQAA